MHVFPIVLVTAETPEGALAQADEFLDELVERSDGLFDYGRIADGAAPIPAGTREYVDDIRHAIGAETGTVQEYWDAVRAAMRSLTDRETVPDDAEQVHVCYRLGTSITGIVEAGHEVDTDTSFRLVLYSAYKLYILRNHMDDRTGDHPGSDAWLYDAREDASTPAVEATSGVYAVTLDLHY